MALSRSARIQSFACIAYLTSLLALGGSTLVPSPRAIPFALGLAVGAFFASRRLVTQWRDFPFAFATLAASPVLIALIQLVPLPTSFLAIASGQSLAIAVRALAAPQADATISLDHLATTLAGLQAAVFSVACLLLHRVRYQHRIALYAVFTALGFVSTVVSLTQYMTGGTVFNFYHSSQVSYAPGLFANRNHGALFIGCCLTFAGVFLSRQRLSAQLKLGLFAAASAPALAVIALTGSRAGLVISGTMALSVALLMPRPSPMSGRTFNGVRDMRIVVALIIVSFLVFVAYVPLSGNTASRLTTIDGDLRWSIWQNSIVLAGQYFPWGSGLGTFPSVYALSEHLSDLQPFYINHAHNDWIEAIVEVGVFVLVPLTAGICLLAQAIKASRTLDPIRKMDFRIGLIVTGGILAHSLVDYPLRTPTLALTFAFALALVASSLSPSRHKSTSS